MSRFGRHHSWSESSSDEKEIVLKVWLGSLVCLIGINGWMLYEGIWDELFKVTFSNFPIWVVLVGGWAYFVIWWRQHENFSDGECIFACCVAPFFVYTATAVGYFFCTDLNDIEVYNGHAVRFEYTERYSVTTGSGKNRSTTYYGPYYKVYTNNKMQNGAEEVIDASNAEYSAYRQRWGEKNVTKVRNTKADSWFSYIFTVSWNGDLQTRVPTSIEHYYVNYVKASHSIRKTHAALTGYDAVLKQYPRVTPGPYGKICFDRVVEAGVQCSADCKTAINTVLRDSLCTLGSRKEVNVIVYMVKSDQNFFNALREFWVGGKDNDVVVIIGTDGALIEWVRVMSWTDNQEFIEALQDNVRAIKHLSGKGEEIGKAIITQIEESGNRGFKRKPMSDFESEITDIGMPLWGYLPIFLFIIVGTLPTLWLCIHD